MSFRPQSFGTFLGDAIFSSLIGNYSSSEQYHEGSQDDEEPGADPRGHLTDLATVCAQDSGYQKGLRHLRWLS